jgi:hypothetical protein
MAAILGRGQDKTVSEVELPESGEDENIDIGEGGNFSGEPEDEHKDIQTGLYLNTDFDTPIDVSGEAGVNIVEKAIAYVNIAANAEKGAYTLLVGEDTVIGPQIISAANLNLTLQGTGAERVISFSGSPGETSSFIYIDNGAVLVLDRDITLQGNNNNNFNALVWVYSNGTLEMNDGAKITGHTANCGGGVMVYGTFIMNGGAISGNTAQNGGGVRVEEGTFTMNGGTISGNTAQYGGGVSVEEDSIFTIGGTSVISGNTVSSTNSTLNNVYLYDQQYITLGTGANGATVPTAGMSIYVTASADSVIVQSGASANHVQYFHADAAGKIVEYDGGQLVIRNLTGSTLQSLIDNAAVGGTVTVPAGTYLVSAEVTVGANKNLILTTAPGQTVTLENSNTSASAVNMLRVSGGGRMTLKPASGGSIVIDGQKSGPVAALVAVDDGTLTMESGVAIKNSNGNGVSVNVNGELVMIGGEISGNEAPSGNGGGVLVTGGQFTMSGGKITDNKGSPPTNGGAGSGGKGGGVSLLDGGVFNMTGGEISGNKVPPGSGPASGGGVYVGTDSEFTMNGGTISNNRTASNGGGVLVNDGGTFKKTGGTIYGSGEGANSNNAEGQGHAIAHYVASPSAAVERQRNTTVGTNVRLYVSGVNTVDPDDGFDTAVNWTD